MIQTIQLFTARFSAWLAADPSHAELWRSVGMTLAIVCIGFLAFEQLRAQLAEQQQ